MTRLETLKTSAAGNISKEDAMRWMNSLTPPTDDELLASITPKRYGSKGSTFASPASEIRVSGTPEFLEIFAGLLKPLLEAETGRTRLDLKLQKIKDRDTGKLTDDYSLHLHVAERGSGKRFTTHDDIPEDQHAIRYNRGV